MLHLFLAFLKSPAGKRTGLVLLGAVAATFAGYVASTTGVPVDALTGIVAQTPACAPPVICPDAPACVCPAVLKCDCGEAKPAIPPSPSDADRDLK